VKNLDHGDSGHIIGHIRRQSHSFRSRESNFRPHGQNIGRRGDLAVPVSVRPNLGCAVLTAQPGLYGGLAEGGPIIPI
jgi:hypothetical protein